MSRTALTVQVISRSGLAPSFAAANTDGHAVPNDGRMFVHVKNASGSAVTVTIQTPGTVDGMAVADRTVSVAATTGERMIGPFPPSQYNQIAADVGSIYVDFSAVASVSVAAFSMDS